MNMQCNQPVVRLNPALNVACQPLGLILLLLISLLADVSIASETILIDDFSCLDSWKVTQEPAAIEACEGEAAGNAAMRIRMPGMVRKNFGTYWFSGSEEIEMDTVEGVSFKVKGDGSNQFSYISANDRYGYSYVFAFPLKNTQWHTFYVRWKDFIPQ